MNRVGSVPKASTVVKAAGGSPGPGRPSVVPYKFGVRRPQPYGDNQWVPVNPFISMAPRPQAVQAVTNGLFAAHMPQNLMPEAIKVVNAKQQKYQRRV